MTSLIVSDNDRGITKGEGEHPKEHRCVVELQQHTLQVAGLLRERVSECRIVKVVDSHRKHGGEDNSDDAKARANGSGAERRNAVQACL